MQHRLVTLLAAAAFALAAAAPASAGTANGGLPGASPTNPLAGMTWGTYRLDTTDPSLDGPSAYFNTARSDADRSVFDKLLSQPRIRWFGSWISTFNQGTKWGARKSAQKYVEQVTGGNPDIGVQVGIFRLQPFEHQACTQLPTAAQISDYKAWIQEWAAGMGSARVALVLQPDMPFTLCLPGHSQVDLQLISYAVNVFNALPHTTVYIDAGASDWLKPGTAASMLARAGIRNARGFALDLTHYTSTPSQIAFGKKVLAALARRHIPGKHFLVDTAENGRPFTTQKHKRTFLRGTICATRSSKNCVTLGQPMTTNTASPAVDAYMWTARPWINNTTRRSYDEILRLVRTSPFF